MACFVWNGIIWLRIGSSGGILRTVYWTFWFRKSLKISWRGRLYFLSRYSAQCSSVCECVLFCTRRLLFIIFSRQNYLWLTVPELKTKRSNVSHRCCNIEVNTNCIVKTHKILKHSYRNSLNTELQKVVWCSYLLIIIVDRSVMDLEVSKWFCFIIQKCLSVFRNNTTQFVTFSRSEIPKCRSEALQQHVRRLR
jgi:hypothetical protein